MLDKKCVPNCDKLNSTIKMPTMTGSSRDINDGKRRAGTAAADGNKLFIIDFFYYSFYKTDPRRA